MHNFTSKRNALFACLDDASNELKGTVLDQTNSCTALKKTDKGVEMKYRQDCSTRSQYALHRLRGKESIFKKPELPIARCLKPRKMPDYQLNPHKWKKYSLEDVDISDQTNSIAALTFLNQIEKDNEESAEKYDDQDKKIEFKKSSKIKRTLKSIQSAEQKDAEVDSAKLKGSKLVMPEYIIGQKKNTIKKKTLIASKTSNGKRERAAGSLLLSHLQQEDEVEDDN